MSILLAATVSLGQFCYSAENDINSAEFMRLASYYQPVLTRAMAQKKSQCWAIKGDKQLQEATMLVSMDSTGKTLALK
jgi:hypothetical protein